MALEEGAGGAEDGGEQSSSSAEVVDEALVNAARAMELAQNVFTFSLPDELAGDRATLKEKIMAEIQRNSEFQQCGVRRVCAWANENESKTRSGEGNGFFFVSSSSLFFLRRTLSRKELSGASLLVPAFLLPGRGS